MNDSSMPFMPHGMCFLWRLDILSLHVGSDSLIALSYFCIPALLMTFVRRRPALHLFGWLFSAFIVCCGLTHVLDIWTIWHPDYWLSGSIKAITAIASLATVAALLPLMPFGRILGRFSNLDRLNQELESQYRSIVESSNDGIWLLDSAAQTTFVNARLTKMLGSGSAQMVGVPIGAFVHDETGLAEREQLTRHGVLLAEGGSAAPPIEVCFRRQDGSPLWTEVQFAPIYDADGGLIGSAATIADITDRRRAARLLAESELRYRALTESLPQMVWIADDQVNIHFVNASWLAYTGLTFEPGMPSKTGTIVHPDDVGVLAGAHAALRARTKVDCEVRLRRHDGAYRWHIVRSVHFREMPEGVTHWLVSGTDIEERKSAEAALALAAAELAYRAHYDPLTGLSNRTRLMDRLAQTMLDAKRDATEFIVLYLDLDHFKSVNDTLGHNAGDKLLVEMARRINSVIRTEDVASRFGGDEFILVCPGSGYNDGPLVAERVQAAITAPFVLGEKQVVVSASIGMSVFPQHGSDPADLIQKADAAMYAAKQSGRNAWCIFNPQTPVSAIPDLEFEAELRQAIALEEFVVHYQPILSIASGRPLGAEALVRWLHPTRGLLAPGEFITFAEDHGLIAQIGGLVLDAACAQLRRLNLRAADDFSMAVNVSARQFQKTGFVETIAAAIATHGIEARRLEIEITESVVMGDTAAVLATLDRLRALGVKLSMDDFGTGYSSLSYIKNFPINSLKIDRSFVTDLAISFTDQAIAKAIITLAHSLNMRVIAEGVETLQQLELLRTFDADCFQGYLISRPLTSADFARFMAGSSIAVT